MRVTTVLRSMSGIRKDKVMKSIQKLSSEEKEVRLLIDSLKNVLTDVPYDFVYDNADEDEEDSDEYFD